MGAAPFPAAGGWALRCRIILPCDQDTPDTLIADTATSLQPVEGRQVPGRTAAIRPSSHRAYAATWVVGAKPHGAWPPTRPSATPSSKSPKIAPGPSCSTVPLRETDAWPNISRTRVETPCEHSHVRAPGLSGKEAEECTDGCATELTAG
ncbi:hypothetical protein SNE510_72900 [Streptomyces sp. NE5-10]|nr:hypothetical protein SNE510_72900 [Streptomyces sp. NE5-10]